MWIWGGGNGREGLSLAQIKWGSTVPNAGIGIVFALLGWRYDMDLSQPTHNKKKFLYSARFMT
jgi:hypothetical protein